MFNWGGGSNNKDNNNEQPKPAGLPVIPTPSNTGGSSAVSVHGFDPSSLERAAQAAKDLDRSKNSKEALSLIATQEVTKQKEHEAERAKFQAYQQELAIKKIQEEEQASARTLDRQTEHEKNRAKYQDHLERQRMSDQIEMQRRIQEEERAKAEESLKRQEAIRRKTLEYEAELRQQTEMARVKAETEGKIKQERVNHDLTIENKILDAKEFRETVLQSISAAGTTIGRGISDFVSDTDKLANVTLTVTGIAFGVYTARISLGIMGRFIESRLGKPSLVRDTSRKSVLQMAKSPFSTMRFLLSSGSGEAALKDVILEPTLEERLKRIAVSTTNTRKNNAPFRHVLLCGPPGTGKTMFAKGLARESGLHFAIVTGGDVAPLGKDAVSELHKLFDWAQTTNKGVILFIDEADAFLRKRSTEKISEDMRNALNAFLYRTGEASKKIMVMYASNQPEQFDWAINDRIDEIVQFELPTYNERVKMIIQYMEKYLTKPPPGSKPITVANDIDDTVIDYVAKETEGYSGREISKLAIAWQAAAYGTANAHFDLELLKKVLGENKVSKSQKMLWLSNERIQKITSDERPHK